MKILFPAAVLLGLASARNTLMSASQTTTKTTSVGTFTGSYTATCDYATYFDSGMSSSVAYDSYSLNVAAGIDISFDFNFNDYYQIGVDFTVSLFDFTPIRQYINWVNPVAVLAGDATAYDFGLSAEYDLYFLESAVSYFQAAPEVAFDLYDYFTGLPSGTSAVGDVVPTPSDFSLSSAVYTTSDYLVFSPETYVDAAGNWYGSHTLYNWSLFGNI
jgi:hypothetical protein